MDSLQKKKLLEGLDIRVKTNNDIITSLLKKQEK